ncbi:MAG TPA: glycosyltransferase family 2 protein [Candidatus Competibacteraceae bacterium]|nr:glycosyltransferase family 2 protein [Candidatus Competibacteraceae bacterium]
MAELFFWLALALLFYTYLGYPLLLRLLVRVRPQPVRRAPITPPLTVIVSAYNEERDIQRKLDNLLGQDYPPDRLRIIVASDGSSDRTDELVRSHPDPRVSLNRVEGRRGKTAAQNATVPLAEGEIVVFTDATTALAPDALRQLVQPFADPTVGAVGGGLIYRDRAGSAVGSGGTSYWGYERRLKSLESTVGSLIGVSGCFYAVRKALYRPIPPELISDFVIALDIHEQGYRTVYAPEAMSFEDTLHQPEREFAMRVRVIGRTYAALWAKRHLLNPLRHGLFAVQLLSHKVLRYAAPLLLALLALANLAALPGAPWLALPLIGQLVFYGAALAGHGLRASAHGCGLLAKPYYFVLANLAALSALLRFLRGERWVTWEPLR